MSEALAELDQADRVNYSETALKHNVSRQALSRRHKGESTSRAKATSNLRQALTGAQETMLVERISTLSVQGLPTTPQVVRDLAERIAEKPLGECWTRRFVQRHSEVLESIYLKPIDKQRKWAESVSYIEAFYKLVLVFLVSLTNNY